MRVFNQALLARQAWRLIERPDSLCARVLKTKYYPQGNIIDTVFTGNPSSTWTAISYGLELLKKGMIWRIGNGESVRMWRDNWIPHDFRLKPIGHRGKSRLNRVSSLIDEYGVWKEDLVRKNFPPIDASIILRIKTSPRREADFLAWQPKKNVVFTVRSAYKLAMSLMQQEQGCVASSNSPVGDKPIWKLIWKSQVPEKVRIFAWRAVHGALATEENKRRRGIHVTGICLVCGREPEDTSHMFI
jgi:hypothetical protein